LEDELDLVDRIVIQADEHVRCADDLGEAASDQLDDRVEVELLGERAADLVDQRQLGIALAELRRGARSLERRRDVLGDEGQELLIGLVVVDVVAVALHGQDPDRPAVYPERDAEVVVRHRALGGDVRTVVAAAMGELACLQDVRGHPAVVVDRDRSPAVGIGVLGVDVERERDLATVGVVQRDVQVLGIQQLGDDLVDAAVEVVHLGGAARQLRDPVQRGLGLRRAHCSGQRRLELGDSRLRVVRGPGLRSRRSADLRGDARASWSRRAPSPRSAEDSQRPPSEAIASRHMPEPWVRPVTLEGLIVRLEPLSLDHLDGLAEVAFVESIWRWTLHQPTEIGGLRTWVEAALAGRAGGSEMPFATIEAATGKPIGSTRFMSIVPEHRRLEIGWTWVAPAWQRKG